jgi:hypothetical protein
MAHRRYTVQLQDADGRTVGLRIEPFAILDFEDHALEADRQLGALLTDLAATHDPYPQSPRTYRLGVYDAETGTLIGHWTSH